MPEYDLHLRPSSPIEPRLFRSVYLGTLNEQIESVAERLLAHPGDLEELLPRYPVRAGLPDFNLELARALTCATFSRWQIVRSHASSLRRSIALIRAR